MIRRKSQLKFIFTKLGNFLVFVQSWNLDSASKITYKSMKTLLPRIFASPLPCLPGLTAYWWLLVFAQTREASSIFGTSYVFDNCSSYLYTLILSLIFLIRLPGHRRRPNLDPKTLAAVSPMPIERMPARRGIRSHLSTGWGWIQTGMEQPTRR